MAGSDAQVTIDRLHVLWREPRARGGTRHVIGDLSRVPKSGFCFRYAPDLTSAESAGFALLAEFPERRSEPYRSPYLFSTFAQRVPSLKRPDRDAIVTAWGVEERDNPLEFLARSGGIQLTDRIELAEWRAPDDDLSRPLQFRIAGQERYHGASMLVPEARLFLKREQANQFDPHAVLIEETSQGATLGYVPRQHSSLVASQLERGIVLEARAVRCLALPAEPGRWVAEVRTSAARPQTPKSGAP